MKSQFGRTYAMLLSVMLTLLLSMPIVHASSTIQSPHWLIQIWTPGTAPRTLLAHQADLPTWPASLTKLLTAYTVLKSNANPQLLLVQTLTISPYCAKTEGTKVGYYEGEHVQLLDALQGMLAISGNDAACAIAEHIDGTVLQFAKRMNTQSEQLKLTHSQWANPHGLHDDNHYSSALDLAKIAHALWFEFPFAQTWLNQKNYTWHGITQFNRNTLLRKDVFADGLKSGHTKIAGYNLAGTQNWRVQIEQDQFDWRLSTIVLGASDKVNRHQDTHALLHWVRQNYQAWLLYPSQSQVGTWKLPGVAQAQTLFAHEGVWAVIDKHTPISDIKVTFEALPNLNPPYLAHQVVGNVVTWLGEMPLSKSAVKTIKPIEASSWYAFIWEWIKSTLFA